MLPWIGIISPAAKKTLVRPRHEDQDCQGLGRGNESGGIIPFEGEVRVMENRPAEEAATRHKHSVLVDEEVRRSLGVD